MRTQQHIHLFGEVLFDHFPDGSRVLGGAPFNVAWHLQAFGQTPNFISRIGADHAGQEISDLMTMWGMRLDNVQLDRTHPTGSVQVRMVHAEPHYDIVADSAYDFIASDLLNDQATHGIFYHGSLAIRHKTSRATLQYLTEKHCGKIFIDVNLRPPYWQKDSLFALLHAAHWVKLNEAELKILSNVQGDLHSMMQSFFQQFTLETLIVTCGEQGAIALNKQQQFIHVQPASSTVVVDTVGAGDAFSAVLLLGIHQGWSLAKTLARAQTFAAGLVGQRGATVSEQAFYRHFHAQWQTCL